MSRIPDMFQANKLSTSFMIAICMLATAWAWHSVPMAIVAAGLLVLIGIRALVHAIDRIDAD